MTNIIFFTCLKSFEEKINTENKNDTKWVFDYHKCQLVLTTFCLVARNISILCIKSIFAKDNISFQHFQHVEIAEIYET